MSPPASDLMQGAFEVLILKMLALETTHGWGIGQRSQQVSKDVMQVREGSLYPGLERLEAKWEEIHGGFSDN